MLPVLSVILYLECHLFRRVWAPGVCWGWDSDWFPSVWMQHDPLSVVLSISTCASEIVQCSWCDRFGMHLLWVFCFLLLSMDANQPTRGWKRAGIFFLLLQFYLCFLLYSVCWCLCAVMCGSSNFRWCFLSRSGACQAALLCCTESHRAKTQLLFYRCIHHTRRQKKSHGIKIKQ
jgi:hypothetical protein